jgi:hypothetical protein
MSNAALTVDVSVEHIARGDGAFAGKWLRRRQIAPLSDILPRSATQLEFPTPTPTPSDLGTNEPSGQAMAPVSACAPSLCLGPLQRSNPRWEPSAVVPLARICAAGGPRREPKGRPYRDPTG